jgi:hypothetical protein
MSETSKNDTMDGQKWIKPIFLTSKTSATLIIPIELAKKYDLLDHAHVVIEEQDHGLMIRKINV